MACEAAVTVLGLIGAYFLATNLTAAQDAWDAAKLFGYLTYLAALVVWFGVIQVVGAEWFVSWQSEKWERHPGLEPHQPDYHRRRDPPPALLT